MPPKCRRFRLARRTALGLGTSSFLGKPRSEPRTWKLHTTPVIRQTLSVRTAGSESPYTTYHYTVRVRSLGIRLIQLWLFLCSIEWGEDSDGLWFVLAGAIYLYGNSSIRIDGSSSFTNNHAGGNGGEKRPKIGAGIHLRKGDVCLGRCLAVTRSNYFDIDDYSGADIL